MTLSVAHISPIISIIAGALILIMPRLLNLIVALFLIVNGLMVYWVPGIVRGFHVDGYGSAFWGAVVISIISWLLSAFFRGSDGRVHVLTHHTQMKRVHVIEPESRNQ